MAETTMPATEAEAVAVHDDERASYEFAFHVLPTVAEGEVPAVFAAIKDLIVKDGGELFAEEAPERFDLAYEIDKYLEGKHRKFKSAYFGWVRFKAPAAAITKITDEIDHRPDVLRYLMIRLTKVEEENPFRFHEALANEKQVENIEEREETPDRKDDAEKEKTEAEGADDKAEDAKQSESTEADDGTLEPTESSTEEKKEA